MATRRRSVREAGANGSVPRPRVVIVGGGMGGVQAAKTLAKAPVEITLVSAHNYYLFQPLIYEVANALLQPEDIAHSIRGLLRKHTNVHFQLGAATGVDWGQSELLVDPGEPIGFDYLILATGLEVGFHGAPGAAEHTLPLKTLDDALRMRAQTLRRLETVAAEPALIAAGALDVVVVGGGTTGVETAGAFAEIYHHALQEEFRELELRRASIGLHARVAEVGPTSVTLADGEEIPAGMIVWATGVRATPLADSLGLPQARDGRIFVQPNLSLPGHPQAFAIGDMAALPWRGEQLHPPLAQFAIQGGRHAAREIRRQLDGRPSRRFRYLNKGMTASVGRDAAVVQAGPVRFSGRLAFWFWGLLHWTYIPGWRNKIAVDVNWLWSYATHRRAALLLLEEPEPLDPPDANGSGTPARRRSHRPGDAESASFRRVRSSRRPRQGSPSSRPRDA
jgi:NADH:quinone reductase (non-electrogenic)